MAASRAVQRALLFVAPIMPAASGNGLAMRAGVFLDALARDFAVTLLVVPVAGRVPRTSSEFAVERAARVVTIALDAHVDPLWTLLGRIADGDARSAAFVKYPQPAMCRHATASYRTEAARMLGGARFDAVHVMRSYMAPYAELFLVGAGERAVPSASLDLDDDEALTQRRMATLAEGRADFANARFFRAEAMKYERLQSEWMARFQLLLVANPEHATRLAADHRDRAATVIPNTVALPPLRRRARHAEARILFVGNLSYAPNIDGIRRFATDVLPRIAARSRDRVTLHIAGSAPGPDAIALTKLHGVELVADPEDIAECYASADLAVVPLAAGGGTRIKLLEAFAHGVPVVATPIGAEGIAATHGVHLLIAELSTAFADACASVLSDRALAARLAEAARALVAARYTHAHGLRAIGESFGRLYSA